MKLCLVALGLLISGCWGGGDNDFSPSKPPTVPEISYEPTPDPVFPITTTKNYRPDWYPYDPLGSVDNDDIPYYDSLFGYFKAIYDQWGETITPGFVPDYYLENIPKAPEHISWIDETKGRVRGFDKLKKVLPRIYKRCPVLNDDRFKMPLEVNWVDNSYPHNGVHTPLLPRLLTAGSGDLSYGRPYLSATIKIKGEFLRSNGNVVWQYPKQTHKEMTGIEVWEEGFYESQTLDQTFAHEYGHFIFNAWAINSGKPGFGTNYFHEQFAELFKKLCYGDFEDRATYPLQGDIRRLEEDIKEFGRPFERHKDRLEKGAGSLFGVQYTLRAFEYLIHWEKYNDRYDPYKVFLALVKTLENMAGRFPPQCPTLVRQERTQEKREITCPWEPDWNSEPETAAMKTLVFTRAELAEKFCEFYDCTEAAHIFESEAIGMRKNEW